MIVEHGWDKKLKSVIQGTDGNQVVVEMPIIQVIREPNRHRMENIVKALCFVAAELVDARLAEEKKVMDLYSKLTEGRNGGLGSSVGTTAGNGEIVQQSDA